MNPTTQHPVASASLDLDKLRAEFEQLMRGDTNLARSPSGDYLALATMFKWHGFALARRATHQPSEADERALFDRVDSALYQCIEATRGHPYTERPRLEGEEVLAEFRAYLTALTHRATTAEQQADDAAWQKERADRLAGKLESVWEGIREAVQKYSGVPCEGEPFDQLDGLLARLTSTAATTASASEPDHFYTFSKPDGWINLLNPGQSWEEWTRAQGIPTTRGWKVHGRAPAPSREAATYTVDGVVMSPLEYIAHLHDKLAQQSAAPGADWRVGEFWSSANPGTKVVMLACGSDIENFGRHKDFIRWVGAAQAQAGRSGALKLAIIAACESNEREMEGYSYFGSNPGVPKDSYDDVADAVIAAMSASGQEGGHHD